MKFKCKNCGKVSSAEEINNATIKQFGNDIVLIEDVCGHDEADFICPKCNKCLSDTEFEINLSQQKINTLELIEKLNLLSPYGITITNNELNDEDMNDDNKEMNEIRTQKTKEWQVTTHFNQMWSDISYTSYNKDLDSALREAIDWYKGMEDIINKE